MSIIVLKAKKLLIGSSIFQNKTGGLYSRQVALRPLMVSRVNDSPIRMQVATSDKKFILFTALWYYEHLMRAQKAKQWAPLSALGSP